VTDTVNISGDKNFTAGTSLVSSGGATILKTVNASTATGNVSIVLAAATNADFAYRGGSGNDTVRFADNALAALTSGSQLDGGAGASDKIAILDTALTVAEYKAINDAKNFEVLGLRAAITVDASTLTSIKSFALDANAAQVITNMATGSTVAVTAAHAAAITTGGAVGVSNLTFNVGTATTTGITLGGNVTIGQTNVAMSSNGTNAAANTITTLVNSDNSSYTVTGSNDLTIAAMSATATGSRIDATAFTGKLNVTGNATAFAAGSALGDVLIGGSGTDTFVASVNGGTLTGNAGNDNFNVGLAVAGAAPGAGLSTSSTIAITTITDFTKGDKITFAGAAAFTTTKVDLSAAASLAAAFDLLVAGNATDIRWGTYGGNTYIVDDDGAGLTVAATDTIVKLNGVLDLSTSTLAANAITYA